ncbi:DUF4397 domain-containing protein [Streptomyces sp. t39]|uniref:DUF4397 domain-containing protein n=1 Tax=Streptomyces sp. t39 TaxID=1828156 RepID=UPI0011CDF321|nr:DUF4397 domain-containing protein [Streptomyces sp. t39]TXS54324.1 DUF4397 domain-containing protein [Streptomyces sp. t39]
MTSRTPLAVAAVAGVCAIGLGTAVPALAAPQAQQDKAMVSVFHGVPGLDVDVYANGDELLGDFKPGTVTEPQALDAGTYDIQVFKAGSDPGGTPAIEKKIEVAAGSDATVAAHLSADGTPQLTAFADDTDEVQSGKARLTVRHVAAAPAVDVRAGGTPLFSDLVNPKEGTAEVDAGTVSADVVLAGTDTVAIGPADLDLKSGTGTVVYAWGSADDKNLALATQAIDTAKASPNADSAGVAAGPWYVWAGAGLLAAAGALAVRGGMKWDG